MMMHRWGSQDGTLESHVPQEDDDVQYGSTYMHHIIATSYQERRRRGGMIGGMAIHETYHMSISFEIDIVFVIIIMCQRSNLTTYQSTE